MFVCETARFGHVRRVGRSKAPPGWGFVDVECELVRAGKYVLCIVVSRVGSCYESNELLQGDISQLNSVQVYVQRPLKVVKREEDKQIRKKKGCVCESRKYLRKYKCRPNWYNSKYKYNTSMSKHKRKKKKSEYKSTNEKQARQ